MILLVLLDIVIYANLILNIILSDINLEVCKITETQAACTHYNMPNAVSVSNSINSI